MLLKWSITPETLSKNNEYILQIVIENDENIRLFIKKVKLCVLDLKLEQLKEIDQKLGTTFLGIFKKRMNIDFHLIIDKDIVNVHQFTIQIQFNKYINEKWSPILYDERGPQNFQIATIPIYKAFLSRTVRENERYVPDKISKSITRWGFNLSTVGIPPLRKQYTDEELLKTIKFEIKRADIVFAIATKRDKLSNSIGWKTFEWLQSETAIAYTLNKQIIVFVEEGVKISGLASKLINLPFNLENLHVIDEFFDQCMCQIRDNIQERRDSKFLKNLLIAGEIALSFGLIGGLGYQLGKKSHENDK